MTAPSPTPRRVKKPSWLDPRLFIGVILVLGSVLLGAKLVAGANHSYRFLAFSRDLAAGTMMSAGDVQIVQAQLPGRARGVYLADLAAAVGRQLNREVRQGELVPNAALEVAAASTTLTIPLASDAAPVLSAGQRIRVWLSTKLCPSVVVLADVTVQGVRDASGSSFSSAGGEDVIVSVSPELADRVVAALARDGATIRAGLITGPALPNANDGLATLSCAGSGS